MNTENQSKLVGIVAKVAEKEGEEIALDASLQDDLDIDSFRRADLSFEIDKAFGINLAGAERTKYDLAFARCETLSELITHVGSYIG